MDIELKKYEKKSYIRRVIVSWVTILCIVVCVYAFIPNKCYAVDADDLGFGGIVGFLCGGKVADVFYDALESLTGGSFIQNILNCFYQGTLSDDGLTIIESIMGDVEGQTEPFMKDLSTALKAIAMLFITYHMLVSIAREMERGQMTTESWLRVLIAFVIPCAMIIDADVIIKGFGDIGYWMYENLYGFDLSVTDNNMSWEEVEWPGGFDFWTDDLGDWLEEVFDYLFGIVRGLLLVIIYGIINMIIVIPILSGFMSNVVEIVLRHLMLPLAIANISHEGVRSAGVRYIKKYFGCFIKIGTIMVAIAAVFYVYRKTLQLEICNVAVAGPFFKVLFFFLLVPGTKQALKMTNEIVNDALGV